MRYVIIGNSAAAVGCVEGIRQLDSQGSITIVSKEPYHTYSRPLISYLLCGKTDAERMKYRPDDFYTRNKVTFLPGKTAEAIRPEQKTVLLDDGRELPYDRLLCATGSVPFVPPMDGLDTVEQKFTFLSLADARAIEDAITPKSRVLILGAGLIGLKCAEGIAGRVERITVVDLADRILSSILDDDAAMMVQAHLEANGIRFRLSDAAERFAPHTAYLKSGASIEFDVLIVAVGVRPNTALLEAAGAAADRGAETDALCRTTLPGVYAAGDCAKSFDIAAGQARTLALLPNAYMQGECAGINMAGGEKRYTDAIAMNAIGFFGLHMITAGCYEGESYVMRGDTAYKRLFVKDGALKGYILLGDVARAGIYTALIRRQTPLDTVDFELLKEKPQLMAFSEAARAEMLGGVPV